MFVGTAGWNIPNEFHSHFPEEGGHLARYARVLNMAEINSSFYKEHMAKTYARWAAEVPENFRFSVKVSKAFTHEARLRAKAKDVLASLDNILNLGDKLGALLIQLPGSLEFNPKDAERFYAILRKKYQGPLALEARNVGWMAREGQQLMLDYKVSKVFADPERCPGGGKRLRACGGISYFRLHGSPIIYKSVYPKKFLKQLAQELAGARNPWCIFDNTTFGAATGNALELKKMS